MYIDIKSQWFATIKPHRQATHVFPPHRLCKEPLEEYAPKACKVQRQGQQLSPFYNVIKVERTLWYICNHVTSYVTFHYNCFSITNCYKRRDSRTRKKETSLFHFMGFTSYFFFFRATFFLFFLFPRFFLTLDVYGTLVYPPRSREHFGDNGNFYCPVFRYIRLYIDAIE